MYSEELETYYTGPEKPCTFELSFESSFKGPLAIRTMIISLSKPLEPLVRCHHHIKNDHSENKHHVVVRLDGQAKYVGTPEAKDYNNRLAMIIEMGIRNRKSVTFEFKCLSSCHKISKISTALAFYFEDAVSGEILGQKIIAINISKNYERDMRAAENALKRKLPIDSNEQIQKVIKRDCLVQPSLEEFYEYTIKLPKKRPHVFKNVLQSIANTLAASMYEADDADEQRDIKLPHDEVKQRLCSIE